MEEEAKLARTMQAIYVLPRDAMSDAIQRQSLTEIMDMLDDGDNGILTHPATVPALPCKWRWHRETKTLCGFSFYPECMSTRGGKYQSALLATTICGHENIARLLLDYGASVLEDGGRYVSPLYQAISHSDEDGAHLLLKRGAWLTQGVLDPANRGGLRWILVEKGYSGFRR